MNEKRLLAYRRGEIDLGQLLAEHARYVERMSGYFGRAEVVRAVHSLEDLASIARTEIWLAAEAYRWRCQACARSAASEADFVAHRADRHPGFTEGPFPRISQYVHGRVGRALHSAAHKPLVEAARYGRKLRIDTGAGFAPDEPRAVVATASHEAEVEFRELVARASRELGPGTADLIDRLAAGEKLGRTTAGRRLVAWLRERSVA